MWRIAEMEDSGERGNQRWRIAEMEDSRDRG